MSTFTLLHRRLPPSLSPHRHPQPQLGATAPIPQGEHRRWVGAHGRNKLRCDEDNDGTRPPHTAGACGKAARPGPALASPGTTKAAGLPQGSARPGSGGARAVRRAARRKSIQNRERDGRNGPPKAPAGPPPPEARTASPQHGRACGGATKRRGPAEGGGHSPGGDELSRGRCGRPGPPGRGRGRRAAPLCSPLLSLRGRGAGGQASEWPRRGGAGRAGRAAPPLRPGRASAGGTAAAAAASWPRGRSGPIKAGPDRGGRARRGGGCGAAPRGGWWPS